MPQGIVHAVSEVVGFAKTGGLADVGAALPRALARRGRACTVILPLYRAARVGHTPVFPTDHTFTVGVGTRQISGRLWKSTLPDSEVPVYLIENSELFERDDPAEGRGLYHFTLPGGARRDYPDNCVRFLFFAKAVLETIRLLELEPSILHCHDWQAGMVPVLLKEIYARFAAPGLRERYQAIRSVFTIHNIAYQGVCRGVEFPLTGLEWRLFNFKQLEFYGNWSFLKGGIVFSDWVTTVSPTYAEEIQTPQYSYGMHGILTERRPRLSGIVNGVDYREWGPAADPLIVRTYTPETVAEGKAECKAALQRRYGLAEDPKAPLLAMVARLVEQKGIDLLVRVADRLFHDPELGVQLVVLGEGDPAYHRMLIEIRDRHRDRFGLTLAFDEGLAHQVEAGADIFLMPSQYEPSGLNQLYSLRYGTVPVVRACGGLNDTITDCTPETLAAGTATGFRFIHYTPEGLLWAVRQAVQLYRHDPDQWRRLQLNGMRQDWSWDRSAAEYEKVYSRLVAGG